MPADRPHAQLALIVLLLLVQLFLRVHHPLALPAFVDEESHITRAKIIYHFDHNPVETSHGKLLYYYWLGLFGPGEYGELVVSRLATALFSLIGSAAIMAAARDLFGRRAMIPSSAFYALAPYALFYERMALADPFAGALVTLTAWQSIRLARRPALARGAAVGLLAGMAALAKLTTAFVVGLPVIAALMLGVARAPGCNWAAIRSWERTLWQRYSRSLVVAGAACYLLWLPVLGSALWIRVVDQRSAILVTTHLFDTEQKTSALPDKVDGLADAVVTMLSMPMTLILVGLVVLLLWKRRDEAIFTLGWLVLLWGPSTLLKSSTEPRYLVAGVPALAVLFGGGMVVIGELLAEALGKFLPHPPALYTNAGARKAAPLQNWSFFRQVEAGTASSIVQGITTSAVIGVWAVGFALPFAYHAANDPVKLELTDKDTYNYFYGLYNGWGVSRSFDYLDEHAERVNGRIPIAVVMRNCGVYLMHRTEQFNDNCTDEHNFPRYATVHDMRLWASLLRELEKWPFVYVITEYVPVDFSSPDDSLRWDLLYHFKRPHSDEDARTVSVWRVERIEAGG